MDFAAVVHKHKARFASQADFFDWVMMEIQSHMIQVEDLRREKDPEMEAEIADLAALALLLAKAHAVEEKEILQRATKF